MKRILHSLFISAVLIFNALFISQITFAQDANTPPGGGTVIQPGAVNDNANDTTSVGTTASSFNPLWLLPIVAIPLLAYLLWPRQRDEELAETEYGYGTGLAGVKGGKASRRNQLDTDQQDED